MARSDFEKFAEDAAGHPLDVYGRKLFEEAPSTFAPADGVPVPATYVLGPGDELLIHVWGKIDFDGRMTVDRNGQIYLPRAGVLAVTGLRYDQLESYLRKAVGRIYKDFELSVTLGQLRSIQVLVLGSARQPGAYTVSSLSTLVDAIFASGGPSEVGSMRRIELRRGTKIVTELDLYDLIRNGNKLLDAQLLPGDVIYIPAVGPQVAILDNVNEPGIYELKADTTIASALEAAGGLTNLAGIDRVLLERIENHHQRSVDEFALDSSGLQRLLSDGDLLRIFPISPKFENAVTIRGNFATPGRFRWHEGMRISDVIPTRRSLVTRMYWNQLNQLEPEVHHETQENLRQESDLQASPGLTEGHLHNKDFHPTPDNQSRHDLLGELDSIDSEINWDYAVIERLDERDLSVHVIPFNLGQAIDNPESVDNKVLMIGDILTIPSRNDIPLSFEKHASFVKVTGEVGAPGVYRISPGDTLRDVVRLAGGLTIHAYLYASQLTRVSTRQVQEEQLKLSIDRLSKELVARNASSTRGAAEAALAPQASAQMTADQKSQVDIQQNILSQLVQTRPSGRVVLGMPPEAKDLNDIPAFALEDGDTFYIPPQLGTIQVIGEVYNENAFRYQARRPLEQYLSDSGGPTGIADLKRIFLIRADGTIVSRKSHNAFSSGHFDKLILMPGDAVIVPPKLRFSGGFMSQLPMITQVLSQSATTGAVISLVH